MCLRLRLNLALFEVRDYLLSLFETELLKTASSNVDDILDNQNISCSENPQFSHLSPRETQKQGGT